MRSVGEAGRVALGRIRSAPWLVVLGVASLLATVGATVLTDAVVGGAGGPTVLGSVLSLVALGALVALFRSLLLAVPLSAGLPAVAAVGDRRRVRSALGDGATGRAWAVLVTVPVVFAVGAAVTVVAFVAALAVYAPLATVAQAAGYALGFGASDALALGVLGALLPLCAGAAVAAGSVGLVAPEVADGVDLATAVRRAFRRLARSPRRAFGHGLVVLALFLTPLLGTLLVAFAFSTVGFEGTEGAVTLGVVAVVTAVFAYTLGPVYRAAAAGAAGGSTTDGSTTEGSAAGGSTTRGSAAGGSTAGGSATGGSTTQGSAAGGSTAGGSAVMGDPGPILTGRRVAVVLVVSGLVLGATGAVRVADVAPEPGGPPPGYDPGGSPAATVEAGVAALTAHDRVLTRTVSVREPPDAEARVTRETVVRFDPADREVSSVSYWHDPDPAEGDPAWTLRGRYVSETADVTHLAGIESSSRPSLARLRTATEGWLVRPSLDLAYAPTDPGSGAWPSLESVPPDTFAVVESGADRVVLETRSVDAFRNLEGYDPDRVVDGYLRVVVDPDTGYPTRVVSHRVTVDRNADGGEPRRRVTHEVTRIERRPVDVTRPPGAPGKGLVEYLYDALVY